MMLHINEEVMENIWYVYILRCSNGSPYVGFTSDIDRRIKEHNHKKIHYTKDKTPVSLICFTGFIDKYKALDYERYLKSGSGISFRRRHLI